MMKKYLSNVLASLELAAGVVFVGFSLWAATGIPNSLSKFTREPEDFFILISGFLICSVIGFVTVITGTAILRERVLWKFSGKRLVLLNVLCAVLLLFLATIGAFLEGAASLELIALFIPAAVILMCIPSIKSIANSRN